MGLLVAVILLVTIGIAMVLSTSYPLADAWRSGDSFYLLKRHLLSVLAGGVMLLIGYRLPTRALNRGAGVIFALSVILLIAVKVFGREVNGARSWFPLGPVNFQPSEFAKVALVLALARHFASRREAGGGRGLAAPVIMLALSAGLIAIEPDMGSAALLVLSSLVFLNICGVPLRRVAALAGAVLLLGGMMVLHKPYQLRRVTDWLNLEASASAGGYQTARSLVALGSGGPFGLGFCQGREKYFYLPASTTDAILAVIGEELGLVGTWAVLALLAWVVWRGFAISRAQRDRFSALAAAGIACLIGTQAVVNVAVVSGSIPATGVPLPFISFGGSSLAFTLFGVGLLLRLSRGKRGPPEVWRAKLRRAGEGERSLPGAAA